MRRLCRGPPTFGAVQGWAFTLSGLGFLKGTGAVSMPAHAWQCVACWGSLRLDAPIVLARGRGVGCPPLSWELLEDRRADRSCVFRSGAERSGFCMRRDCLDRCGVTAGAGGGLGKSSFSPRDSRVQLGFWKRKQQLSLFTDFSFSFKTELHVIN